MDVIELEPVDAVRVTTVMDNVTDLTVGPADGVVRRSFGALPHTTSPVLTGDSWDAFRGEHGFSALVEVESAGRTSTLLFDAGLTPTGVIENLDRLERSPRDLEAIVLSHGHFDHTGGMAGIIDRVGTAGLPVLIHPEFWNRRRISVPGSDPLELPTTSRKALEDAGFDIIEDRRPSFLFDRRVLVTGEIDRTTGFEPGMPGQETWRHDRWEAEPETLDDQALVIHVAGKGLVVMSGCGHAGIVNTVRHAMRLTGVDTVHAVIGGFHLGPPRFHALIDRTVEALLDLAPGVIVPAHCTGWKAQMAFAEALPDAFIPNSIGTTFEL